MDWTQTADDSRVGEATFEGLAIHDRQIVVVGAGLRPPGPDAAMAWRSLDGVGWEPIILSGDDAGNAVDVIATDSGFVAVGSRLGVVTGAIAWLSEDGAEWHEVVLSQRDEISADRVAGSGDRFVAIGANAGTLGNGPITWSILTASAPPRPLAVDGQVRGIAAIGNRYVGIGAAGCPTIGIAGDCSTPLLFFGLPPGSSPPQVIVAS